MKKVQKIGDRNFWRLWWRIIALLYHWGIDVFNINEFIVRDPEGKWQDE